MCFQSQNVIAFKLTRHIHFVVTPSWAEKRVENGGQKTKIGVSWEAFKRTALSSIEFDVLFEDNREIIVNIRQVKYNFGRFLEYRNFQRTSVTARR